MIYNIIYTPHMALHATEKANITNDSLNKDGNVHYPHWENSHQLWSVTCLCALMPPTHPESMLTYGRL